MPQLDFSTYLPQVVWLAISFGLLYMGLSRFLMPQLQKVLDARTRHLEKLQAKTEALILETQRVQSKMDQATLAASERSQTMMQDACDQLAAAHKAEEDKLMRAFSERFHEAEKHMEEARAKSMFEARKCIVELSQHLGHKLTGAPVSLAKIESLIDEAIHESSDH